MYRRYFDYDEKEKKYTFGENISTRAPVYLPLGTFLIQFLNTNIDTIYMRPSHNQLNNLVYASCGSDIVMTMVDGRVLYDRGSFQHLDIEKLLYETEHSCQRILRELQSVQS